MVPGLANHNGHRNNKEGSLQWGGKRVKSYVSRVDSWLEPETRAVIEANDGSQEWEVSLSENKIQEIK